MTNDTIPPKFNRRQFLQVSGAVLGAVTVGGCVINASTPPPTTDHLGNEAITKLETEAAALEQPPPSSGDPKKDALVQLVVGNLRYIAGTVKHPHQSVQRRLDLTAGQQPIAAILSCSDSRVPPEVIFDQGLGDLFVIRVAGNTAGFRDVLASLEYAVEHLKVPLVMVLGHQKCGAVTAALQGTKFEGNLADLMNALKPAVEYSKNKPGDQLESAIRANVTLARQQVMEEAPLVAEAVAAGHVDVVGAYYSLETGKVDLI